MPKVAEPDGGLAGRFPVPQKLFELIDKFERNRAQYESPGYNEAQTRQEFINPFLKLLGWDVDNEQGYAETYKEVIHEDAIRIGKTKKAPDYSCRIGGVRKFFVEAKKPSVNINMDPEPALQLRRYGWNAKLPLCILTDFGEFAVYDTRIAPKPSDDSKVARVPGGYLQFTDYPRRWSMIYGTFSKDAVLKGSFDQYIESFKKLRGISEVDDDFLADIERWRKSLASNVALNNQSLTQREVNLAVQSTIDRIVFLRICEDRGIEPENQLKSLLAGDGTYYRLMRFFVLADQRYNSGLFHFEKEKGRAGSPDNLTPNLEIDDKVLKDVVRRLYPPESPYNFAVIPVEVLGHVYEQFLGKVVRLTEGHRAKIEEKPEVRKAGGVYYTPTYIVDYMVKNTVGKLVEGKAPSQVADLKVLDPACGSGSFLIGAYQFLLDWHRDWHVESAAKKASKPRTKDKTPLYQSAGGQWLLTADERKRILLNNIYGVDIDPQAAEVAKLSLLLKCLEQTPGEIIDRNQKLMHERALPDLDGNVKCGNSLVDPSIYQDQLAVDEEKRSETNPFRWRDEFPQALGRPTPGFDVVIGNPPYISAWELFANSPEVREYINAGAEYETADRHWDAYVLFLEKASKLTRAGGRFAFIIPFSFAIQKYGILPRKNLLSNFTVESVADFRSVRVFGKVPVITIIPVVVKQPPANDSQVEILRPRNESQPEYIELSHQILQSAWLRQHESMIRLDLTEEVEGIVKRVDNRSIGLGTVCYVNYGAQMSSKKKGAFGKEEVIRVKWENDSCRKMISGRELYRYSIQWEGRYVDWTWANRMYGPRWPEFFESPKLMIRDITGTHRIEATLDASGYYCDHTVLCAQRFCDVVEDKRAKGQEITAAEYDLRFLQGVVASKLVSAYYYWVLTGEGVRIGGGFHTYPETIRRFPIVRLSASREDKDRHDRLVTLVDRMLALHRRLAAARLDQDIVQIQRKIQATDREIDALVYSFYELTPEEIALVEGATTKKPVV